MRMFQYRWRRFACWRFAIACLVIALGFATAAIAADSTPPPPNDQSPDEALKKIFQQQAAQEAKQAAQQAQQTKEEAATGIQWATSLDKLPAGGWQLIDVANDGQTAYFGTLHSLRRDGKAIYVWLRFEYRHPQTWQNSVETYLSAVERDRFDCVRQLQQPVQVNGFTKNNLTDPNNDESSTYPETVAWTAAIPGTMGEELMNWACRNAPKAAPRK